MPPKPLPSRFHRLTRVESGLLNKPLTDIPQTAGERRLARRSSLIQPKTAAESAMHRGAVTRPMERDISRHLEQERARSRHEDTAQGTSVYRLRNRRYDEMEEDEAATELPTRAGRRGGQLKLAQLPPEILHPKRKQSPYGDLN